MKKIFIVIVIIILGILGYYMFTKGSTENAGDTNTAKLNMDEVCQGALAYMSFPDAAAAEVFVEECKEGEHPQVIEQYKAQMGISGDVEI